MGRTRAERLEAFEKWADQVSPEELVVHGRSQEIVDLVEGRARADATAQHPEGLDRHRSA